MIGMHANKCGPCQTKPSCSETNISFDSGGSCIGCIIQAGTLLGKVMMCKAPPILQMPGCPVDTSEHPPTLWYISVNGEIVEYDPEVHGPWQTCPEVVQSNTPIHLGEICYS